MTANPLPQSEHFTIELLAEGVWAAIATIEGAAWANCGIVDLGGRTLVFDSGWTPAAGRDLRAAAEALTGRRVDYLLNSHKHSDHVLGNQAFATETDIITTQRTRELIISNCSEVISNAKAHGAQYIAEQEATLAGELDTTRRTLLGFKLNRERQFMAAAPEMELRVPNLTFNNWMIFQSRRHAEALSFGMGHTESDVFLHLPDEGIVFMGDLLSVGYHPSLGDGDPVKWLAVLDQAEALRPQIIVPGHGPVCTVAEFDLLRQYISQLTTLVERVIATGGTADDVAAQPIPAPFSTWYYPDIYAGNMRFLYQFLTRSDKS